ncbi:DNA-binding protein, partial [Escherichia coli]|nr:DNA-binding protein [Escherichia coli]
MADISTPNLDYNDMLEAWDINDALMGGTLEMRRQGENYLPKWPNEDEDAYKKRLSVATLLPVYEESIKQNIGRIFAEPTVLSEETPEKIREYAENIDMEGSRLDVWAQQFFSLAF